LLKPIFVDEDSGYRSYSIDQLPRLNRIIFLKDVGFSLDEVGSLINDYIKIEDMETMLKNKKDTLQNNIELMNYNMRMISDRLLMIENEGTSPKYDIRSKKSKTYVVASLTKVVPHIKDISEYCEKMYAELYNSLMRSNISAIGTEISFYHTEEFEETNLTFETAVAIDPNNSYIDKLSEMGIEVHTIPAEDVVFLIHQGDFSKLQVGIFELVKWIENNDYIIAGPIRELHLSGAVHDENGLQTNMIIEMQIPIKKQIRI